jgi:hypothetical protein
MKNLLTLGYHNFASKDEQLVLTKAVSKMRIKTKVADKFLYGDDLFQKALNTTALTGIDLATTSASGTKVVESFGATTFVKAASSSNYTITVGTKELKATSTASTCIVVSNNYVVTSNGYVVMKTSTEVVGTGTITYEISRDGGITFKRIYPSKGVFIANTPSGTNFCFRITITGNATLTGGIGFSLR